MVVVVNVVVGGLDKNNALHQNVRYAPSEGSATVMNALLPLAASADSRLSFLQDTGTEHPSALLPDGLRF